eukprot:1395416-Amorphochlora_amoeboformis.AAC.1
MYVLAFLSVAAAWVLDEGLCEAFRTPEPDPDPETDDSCCFRGLQLSPSEVPENVSKIETIGFAICMVPYPGPGRRRGHKKPSAIASGP